MDAAEVRELLGMEPLPEPPDVDADAGEDDSHAETVGASAPTADKGSEGGEPDVQDAPLETSTS